MIAEATFFETYWWIIPVIMMALCFFSMRGKGMCMMGGWRETDSHDSALEILDRRYAAGEIDRDEYEERKSVIVR